MQNPIRDNNNQKKKQFGKTYLGIVEIFTNLKLYINLLPARFDQYTSFDGLYPNGTGLEARLMGEVGHSVAKQGVTLKEANEIIGKLLVLYEHVFEMKNGNPGVRFDKAYDLNTLKPVPSWQRMYDTAKSTVRGMGLSTL